MADNKTKAVTKSEVYQRIAQETNLSRKQIAAVFDSLGKIIRQELGKKGPGTLAVGGLMKFKLQRKPATKAGRRPNPFKPGEMMEVKAKPARSDKKARASSDKDDTIPVEF